MKSQELRASFVDFFVSKAHRHEPSATLIPAAHSTTLFTIAGMEQFVPVFTGDAPAPAPRVVTVQRCLRVAGAKSDIENVGRTGRHGTFLEMLGNFSFGDYYKSEAIQFAWEWITDVLGMDKDKIYVTVHTSDDEAAGLWQKLVGLPPERISRFDEDNFWTMGPTGPCGPCTELFYDTGAENQSGPEDTGPNLGTRFVEFWNLVFQQYNRTPDGTLHDLPRKAIDTGAGFERMLAIVNGKVSMFETDIFTDLIDAQPPVGKTSLGSAEQLVRRRIIADHARAITFLIHDGVYPSNTDRGYVLRFLIRRAIRNGRLLDYPAGFLSDLVPAVVTSLEPGYPDLRGSLARVQTALHQEEESFGRTLERGMEMLAEKIGERLDEDGQMLDGAFVFTLADTYGFPFELTREIAIESGLDVDVTAFERLMDEQRKRARADAKSKRAVVAIADLPALTTTFHGYDGLDAHGTIEAILVDGAPAGEAAVGASAQLILDQTSFYAERGGQIGDRGTITLGDAQFEVSDTQAVGGAIAHHGTVRTGTFRAGDRVKTAVDPVWREEIRRHHTSAHLLQRALRDVMGDEIVQAGSWVGIDRMRFDFRSPGGALSAQQRRDVAHRVNQIIREDHHVETEVLPIAEAQRRGAISMAGEKYGDMVRVLKAGPSVEFCGGTHAHSTGELGMFIILNESSIASGVRRIEAVVSKAAEAFVERQQELVARVSESLSARPEELGERVDRLQAEMRELRQTIGDLKSRMAVSDAASFVAAAETIGSTRLVSAVIAEADAEALRNLGVAIRRKFQSGVIVLAGVGAGKVSLFVTASDDLVQRGVHAGNLLKAAVAHVDGKGGGAPAQAQGGGKNPAGVDAALSAIKQALAA